MYHNTRITVTDKGRLLQKDLLKELSRECSPELGAARSILSCPTSPKQIIQKNHIRIKSVTSNWVGDGPNREGYFRRKDSIDFANFISPARIFKETNAMLPLYLRKDNNYPKRHICIFKEKTHSHSDANMPPSKPELKFVHHSEWAATKTPGQNFVNNKFTKNQLPQINLDSVPLSNFNENMLSRQFGISSVPKTEENNFDISHESKFYQDANPTNIRAITDYQLKREKINEEKGPIVSAQSPNQSQFMEKSKSYNTYTQKKRTSINRSIISQEYSSINKVKDDDKSLIEYLEIGSSNFGQQRSPSKQRSPSMKGFYDKVGLKKFGATFSNFYSTRTSPKNSKTFGNQLNLDKLEKMAEIHAISQKKYERALEIVNNKYTEKKILERGDLNEGDAYLQQYEDKNKIIEKMHDRYHVGKLLYQKKVKEIQDKKYDNCWKSMWMLTSKEKRKEQLNWVPKWNHSTFPDNMNLRKDIQDSSTSDIKKL